MFAKRKKQGCAGAGLINARAASAGGVLFRFKTAFEVIVIVDVGNVGATVL